MLNFDLLMLSVLLGLNSLPDQESWANAAPRSIHYKYANAIDGKVTKIVLNKCIL